MKTKILWYVATGAVAGLIAGFLGIGGGIILVPMMVALLGLTQHKAHGTSLAVIVPISIAGAIVYILRGHINWTLVAAIGPASIIGVIIGAKLMMKLPAYRLRQLFGLYTIAIATLLLIR
ncbi:MAG TPA: sulfite exporter TauE/SafE family protein [Dehalococcoidia bacterium]|nr:sulfite exporter TauE/SafE family protein [Dehalococcoidia bacterium]